MGIGKVVTKIRNYVSFVVQQVYYKTKSNELENVYATGLVGHCNTCQSHLKEATMGKMKCPMCGQEVGCVHMEQDTDGSMEYEYYCLNDKCPLQAFTIREKPMRE